MFATFVARGDRARLGRCASFPCDQPLAAGRDLHGRDLLRRDVAGSVPEPIGYWLSDTLLHAVGYTVLALLTLRATAQGPLGRT